MAKAFVKNLSECFPGVPPRHILSRGWSLVTPADTGVDTFKIFSVTEIWNGGAALPDTHPDSDHCYFIISGQGYSIINGKRFEYKKNDVMWIPGNAEHEMYSTGIETLRFAVTLTSMDFNQTEPFVRSVDSMESVVPPKHYDFYCIPVVNPQLGGSNTIEFLISECMPGGRAEADVHADADHVYYFLEGQGYTICDGVKMELKPGDALYIPKGVSHEMYNTGNCVLRMIVTFAPARQVVRK